MIKSPCVYCHVMLCILSCIPMNIGFSLDRKNWLITIISVKSICQATNTPYRTWPIPVQTPPISVQNLCKDHRKSRECTPHKFVPEIFILIGIPKKFYSVDLNPYRYPKNFITGIFILIGYSKKLCFTKNFMVYTIGLVLACIGVKLGQN